MEQNYYLEIILLHISIWKQWSWQEKIKSICACYQQMLTSISTIRRVCVRPYEINLKEDQSMRQTNQWMKPWSAYSKNTRDSKTVGQKSLEKKSCIRACVVANREPLDSVESSEEKLEDDWTICKICKIRWINLAESNSSWEQFDLCSDCTCPGCFNV